MRELFRLSEDEALFIQLYRVLPTHAKAALFTLAELQASRIGQEADNIYPFVAGIRISV